MILRNPRRWVAQAVITIRLGLTSKSLLQILGVESLHFLAIAWNPNNSPTPSSVGYFNFTCKVEDTAPKA